ncbi:ABC transporter permease [Candidatus Micrarchaeota archaeon]|nr:ABC transporter permease [Candidatus Micrarchaeota archaeon]MBU1930665.1 ABC transporter permease [Candidatus Micrarchaeota archaeon]
MQANVKALLFIALILLLWHLVSSTGFFNGTLFPGPLKVLDATINLFESGQLVTDILTSTWRMFFGLLIGASVGVFLGLLMGRVLFLEETVAPFFHILRAFPPVAIIPLLIVWFGIGDIAKIVSIAFAVFFPVWISALVGAKAIQEDFLRTAKVFSKSATQTFSKVVIPATIPFLVSGIRIGIGMAFIMVFVSELAGASSGLGYLIAYAQIVYRIDNMLAGLIILGLLAALTDFLFVKLSQRAFPWVKEYG